MSHIPSSVMKHAGPIHHDEDAKPAASPRSLKTDDAGIGTGAWIAIGGTLLAGAAAAIALPLLLRDRSSHVPTRRGKKATSTKGAGKRKVGKAAQA